MRWRPGLGVRPGSGLQPIRPDLAPGHTLGLQIEPCGRRRRSVDRRGISEAAGCTAAVVGIRLAGRIGGVRGRRPIVMTDGRSERRVGGADTGSPACGDRRENLHRQGDQDDRKEFPQPPAHEQTHPLQRDQLIMLGVRCRDWVPWKLTSSAAKYGIHPEANDESVPPRRSSSPTRLPGTPVGRKIITRKWRNPNHFANCLNFEQSLLKLMTRRKRWSTTAGSGRP